MWSSLPIMMAIVLGQTEPPSAYEHLKELEWLVGDRAGEYVSPEGWPEFGEAGQEVVRQVSCRWGLNKSILIADIKTVVNGDLKLTAKEIVGWSPKSGQVVHWIFSPTGNGSGVWKKEGDEFVLAWSSVTPSGATYSGVSRMRQTGPDTSVWRVDDCKRNGEEIAGIPEVTFKPEPQQLAVTQSTSQDFSDYCRMMQGRWMNASDTLATHWFDFADENARAVSYGEVDVVADGKALQGVWYGGKGTATWLTTWNPVSKQIQSFNVLSDGTVWEEVRFRKGDRAWGCMVTLNRPDGTKEVVTSTLMVSEDGNTHSYLDSEGEKPSVYHRVGRP